MKDTFTNKELGHLNELKDNLILELFYQKRQYRAECLLKYIKKAYLMGREMDTSFINHTPTDVGENKLNGGSYQNGNRKN